MQPIAQRLRRRRPELRSVTAAATRINLEQPKANRRSRRQPWQDECWGFFDNVPEVKHGTWRMGNQIAKVRLVVATMPADGSEPILASAPESTVSPQLAALAEAELARLRSSLGGQPEILRELTMNLDVAGEAYIVGWGAIEDTVGPLGEPVPGRPEDWDVRSISEVEVKGSGDAAQYVIKDSPDDKGQPLNPETDTIIRVWQRHPRWSQLADCAMAGVRGECEALITLHAEVLADSRSRHNAGLLTVANELSFGTVPDDGDAVGDEALADPLTDELTDVFTDPIDATDDPGNVAPTLIRGPAEYLKPDVLRWVDLGRKPSEQLDKRINARVERLARGLNWPVESTMGHQQTTYANAEQVDEDEFSDYHEPRLVLICDALSSGYLRANLVDAGADPVECERLFVWFDASALVRDPDMTAVAEKAHEDLVISGEARRRLTGLSEDDAPDPIEMLWRTGLDRGIFTADLSLALLEQLGVNIDVTPIPKAPAEIPADTAPAETASVRSVLARHPALAVALVERRLSAIPTTVTAAGPRRSRTDGLGRRLMDLDADLRTRLLVLADRSLDRALEKAGNKLRGQASFRPLLKGVAPQVAAAHLGRALVADAGVNPADLLADAFAPMREQFMAWGAQTQHDAIEAVSRAVSGFDAATRASLQMRQADSLNEAWQWLSKALAAHAERGLFDPSALAPAAVGEVAAGMSVPPGMIREALAIAGGGATSSTTDGSAWVTLSQDQYRGGIATGDEMSSAMQAEGLATEAYQWVYGPGGRTRPFEPHMDLDGLVFSDWSDPALAVTGSFPDGAYYLPGDHGGCLCDVAPVIVAADGTVTDDF